MSAEAQLTPMMAQYRRIKGELPKDTLLLFRLGDFYEMFFEDAQTGAQLLNLSLTARNGVPMCGLPFHAANNYIARILRAGRKVAICEQMEDARPGQLVKREVTQILSPGTHFDERMLVAERNNFLAAVCPSGKIFGLALVDLTTGDFLTTELENDSALRITKETNRVYPDSTSTVAIHDEKLQRMIRVEKFNSKSTVVWNPWTTQKLPDDFDPAEHRHMVCVESGNVKQNKILLAPGKTAALKVVLSTGPLQ